MSDRKANNRCNRQIKYKFARFGNRTEVVSFIPDEPSLRTMPVQPKFGGYDERYYRSIVEDPNGGERLKVIEIAQ